MKKSITKIILLAIVCLALLAGCAVGPQAESTPGITTDESYLYVSAATKIYKIDLKNGSEVWRYPSDKGRLMTYAPVFVSGEHFVFGDMLNSLQMLSLEAPNEHVWQFSEAKGWYQAKVAEANDILVAPNTDRNIYAVDLKTGNLKWKHEDHFAFLAEPLILEDTVVVSSQSHEILWLDLNTGKPQADPFKMNGAVIAKPFYLEETGLVYIGSLGHEFVAIDAKTHQEAWRYSGTIENLFGIWAPPIALGGNLIFNDDLGNIIAVDPKTGKEQWVMAAQGKMLAGLVAIDENRFLIAGEDGSIRVFDTERKPVLQFEIPKATIHTTPIVTGGLIIIAPKGAENMIYAYPLESVGMPQWVFKPAK